METYSQAEVNAMMDVDVLEAEYLRDNQGQIVIYTGIFEWKDGTFHDEADPSYDKEG